MSSFSSSLFWKEPSVPMFSFLWGGVAAWKGLWSERTFAEVFLIYKTLDFWRLVEDDLVLN
jgi:hypothetical protein